MMIKFGTSVIGTPKEGKEERKMCKDMGGEFKFCRAFSIDKNGNEVYHELYCRSFSDMYAHIALKGERLTKYIMYT